MQFLAYLILTMIIAFSVAFIISVAIICYRNKKNYIISARMEDNGRPLDDNYESMSLTEILDSYVDSCEIEERED